MGMLCTLTLQLITFLKFHDHFNILFEHKYLLLILFFNHIIRHVCTHLWNMFISEMRFVYANTYNSSLLVDTYLFVCLLILLWWNKDILHLKNHFIVTYQTDRQILESLKLLSQPLCHAWSLEWNVYFLLFLIN
jgi:hypothetical protein